MNVSPEDGGMFNPNILLNALNNLTNSLGAGGNNWMNVKNAVNALNATLTANNNAMQRNIKDSKYGISIQC